MPFHNFHMMQPASTLQLTHYILFRRTPFSLRKAQFNIILFAQVRFAVSTQVSKGCRNPFQRPLVGPDRSDVILACGLLVVPKPMTDPQAGYTRVPHGSSGAVAPFMRAVLPVIRLAVGTF